MVVVGFAGSLASVQRDCVLLTAYADDVGSYVTRYKIVRTCEYVTMLFVTRHELMIAGPPRWERLRRQGRGGGGPERRANWEKGWGFGVNVSQVCKEDPPISEHPVHPPCTPHVHPPVHPMYTPCTPPHVLVTDSHLFTNSRHVAVA
jgi:hypothetical protein